MPLIFVYSYPNILYTHFLNISKVIFIFCIIIDKLFSQRYHFKYEPGFSHLFRRKRRIFHMNHTFGQVAAHCGLRLSYYITTALLCISFFILVITSYRTPTPLYILLVAAVAPSVIKTLLTGNKKQQKRENAVAFPLFCKKYKYDAVLYQSMNISYLLLFILFAAWQISYSRSTSLPVLIYRLPVLLAAISLCIRILGTIGYLLYFRLFPLKAMH